MSAVVQGTIGYANSAAFDLPKAIDFLKQAEKTHIEKCSDVPFFINTNAVNVTRNFLSRVYIYLGRWGELQKQWDTWIKIGQETNDLNLLIWQRSTGPGVIRFLAVDEVNKAREQIMQGLAHWPVQGYDLVRCYANMYELLIERYVGDNERSFKLADEMLKRLSKSPLRRMQINRVQCSYLLAYAALELAKTTKNRMSLLKIVRQQQKRLAAEKCSYAKLFAVSIEGCRACVEGDEDRSVKLLKESATAFQKAQFKMWEAATNRQLGKLLGGDQGCALVAQAEETMKQEGVVRPDRVTAMLITGFFD